MEEVVKKESESLGLCFLLLCFIISFYFIRFTRLGLQHFMLRRRWLRRFNDFAAAQAIK